MKIILRGFRELVVSSGRSTGSRAALLCTANFKPLLTKDAKGNARSLVDILGEVAAATENMGTAEKAEKLNEVFGLLGITAASSIGKSVADTRKLYKELQNAGGIAAKTSEEMEGGLGGAFRILKSSIEGVAIAIGESLKGSVTKMVNAFSRASSGVIEWINKNQKIVKIAAASAVAIFTIGAALFALGSFAAVASFAVGGLATILSFIGGAIGVIVSAVGMLFTPLGLVVAAVAALGGYFLYSTGIAGKAIEYLGSVFEVLKAETLAAFGGIANALAAGDITAAADVLWSYLKLQWIKGTTFLQAKWAEFTQYISDVWADSAYAIGDVLIRALSGLAGVWNSTLGFMADGWTILTSAVQKGWNNTIGFLKKGFLKLHELVDIAGDVSVQIGGVLINALAGVENAWVETVDYLAADKVGRVVFDGVVAARVNVVKAWHQFADVGETGGDTLHSKPDGSAQVLWRQNPESVGLQWAVVRLGKTSQPIYLAKILPGGIPPRISNESGKATCELTLLGENGQIDPVLNPDESPVLIQVFNHSRQRIRGTVSTESEAIYRLIRFNQKDGWAIDPPTQTLLCRPTGRIRPKSWGQARELRLDTGTWKPSGNLIEVYNVCEMALLTSQHVVCHFHEDADSYIGVSSRCCDGSSSSSYSSSSESRSSESKSTPSQSHSDSQSDQSHSEDSDSEESQGSESDDSRSEGSTHSDSAGSDHESDKSTAIVPASFTPGGFTALFTLEAPEVRFDDVFRVQSQPGRITTVAADPRFVEVCERGTLCIDSVVASKPVACGARIDCDGIVHIELDREFTAPVELTIRVTGIRRGFLGKRFPNRTRQQFDANERFLQSAYPGAGK